MKVMYDQIGLLPPFYEGPKNAKVLGKNLQMRKAKADRHGRIVVPTFPPTVPMLKEIISLISGNPKGRVAMVIDRNNPDTPDRRNEMGLIEFDQPYEEFPDKGKNPSRKTKKP